MKFCKIQTKVCKTSKTSRLGQFNIQYVIKSLRSSGFRKRFHHSKTTSIKSLNMGKLVTEEIRHKIIALRQAKFSYPAICKQLNLKNPSTPRTIWNSFAANGTVLPKPKPGRPKILSKRDERFLLRKVQKDRFLSIQKLRTEFNSFSPDKTVSHCTIRRLLARHNLIGRAAAKKLMLRGKTRQGRLRWCRQRRQFGADYWKQFVFTDECRFKIRSDGRVWVRRSQNERYNPRCTLSFSNDCRWLHFWGAITYDGTVRLIKAPEKCNSLDYIHILEEAGVQFFRNWDTSWWTTMLQFIAPMR